MAAAFGAPIGGALFAYEMSKPTSFWTFSMLWKTFITCAFAVLLLGVLQTAFDGMAYALGVSDKFQVRASRTWRAAAPGARLVCVCVCARVRVRVSVCLLYTSPSPRDRG